MKKSEFGIESLCMTLELRSVGNLIRTHYLEGGLHAYNGFCINMYAFYRYLDGYFKIFHLFDLIFAYLQILFDIFINLLVGLKF